MTRAPVPVGVLATIALLVGAGLGCGGPSPSPSPVATPDTIGPLTGGTLRVAMDLATYESYQVNEEGTFDWSFDPQATWAGEPWELFRCCLLRTLMSFNGLSTREGGAELQPDLAADYPVIAADGLTWTFNIKSELHYAPPMADTPIVAQDFVRALERALRASMFAPDEEDRSFTPYGSYLSEVIAGADDYRRGTVSTISGLEVPDEQTLVLHLTRPTGDLGARLALPAAAPLPPGAADGHDAGYGRYLVALGPYMIEGADQLDPTLPPDQQPTLPGYVPGQSLTLVRNPSWDRASDPLRAAYADRIVITQTGDYDADLAALLDDQVDLPFCCDLDPSDLDRFRADGAVASRVHVDSSLASTSILMNLAVAPFDDIHVRRAVNLVTNKRVLLGFLDPSARILSHAIPDAFENDLLADYSPYATDGDSGSVNRAKAEMALSRYDTDANGMCDAAVCNGIYVPVNQDQPEKPAAADAFASQVAQIGIGLNIERVSESDFFGSLDPAAQSPLVFAYGWQSDYFNASAWFGPLATGNGIGFAQNVTMIGATPEQLSNLGYSITDVPGIDERVLACVARTGAAQFECWAQVDQYLMERIVPWVPLNNPQTSRLLSPSVVEFSFDAALSMPALDRIAVRHAP